MLSTRMLSIGLHFTAIFASLDNRSYQGTQTTKNDLKARSFTVHSLYVDLVTAAAMLKGKTEGTDIDSDVSRGVVTRYTSQTKGASPESFRPIQVAHLSPSQAIHDCLRTYRQKSDCQHTSQRAINRVPPCQLRIQRP